MRYRWLGLSAPPADAHPTVTHRRGNRSLTFTFDVDGTCLPLVALSECTLGQPMCAVVLIAHITQPLRTSPVQTIEPLDAENLGQVEEVRDGTA